MRNAALDQEMFAFGAVMKNSIETNAAQAAYTGCVKADGGVIPSRRSRIMPPPQAVVIPRMTQPKISIFL